MNYSPMTEYTDYSLKRVVLLLLRGVFCYYSKLLSSPEKQEKSIRNLGSRRGVFDLSGSSRNVAELPLENTGEVIGKKLFGSRQITIAQLAAGGRRQTVGGMQQTAVTSQQKFPNPCGCITISPERSQEFLQEDLQENFQEHSQEKRNPNSFSRKWRTGKSVSDIRFNNQEHAALAPCWRQQRARQ